MHVRRFIEVSRVLAIVIVLVTLGCGQTGNPIDNSRSLTSGWSLRAAADVGAGPESVSNPGFPMDSWYSSDVPSTAMAALVANDLFPDLYLGTNLENVDTAQFEGAWWYRSEFDVSLSETNSIARLLLEGINYSADIWLNGEKLAGRDEIFGAFRRHEIDVSGRLKDGSNVLAVKVFPPEPGDFTIGFVDWNPKPPDKNMGIWRPVVLRFSGAVSIDDVSVQTDVDIETLKSADISVSAVVQNHTDQQIKTVVSGKIGEIAVAADVTLAANEKRVLWFTPDENEDLRVSEPKLWWPHTLGEANLYTLEMTAEAAGLVSDTSTTTFGIREFASFFNEEGHRGFSVNGVPVLIRGGGWVDDLLLSDTPEKIAAQISYVKQMHLNTIRLEGFWGSNHELYDLADREGVLIMPGWSCQWEWEEYLGKAVSETYGGVLEPDEIDLVATSLGDQVRYLRNHPSIFTWVLASDLLPHPDLERRYESVLADVDPTRPLLASCAFLDSEVSGPSGVKMNGPYDWVPPVYWWSDTKNGGAFGFNTETGPGPQPPPFESLKRMIPQENLWPIDEVWDYHCGRNEFDNMNRYIKALDSRYGPSDSVEEFLFKAQVANYEAIRPMFEAFAVNRPLATGLIQWMLNSAWPETYWQLYDWYLVPNGAFFGTRSACQAINLSYDYDDQTVYAVNDSRHPAHGLAAAVRVFDLGSNEILNKKIPVELEPGQAKPVISLANLQYPTPVFFLDLNLKDQSEVTVARNFYWLTTEADVLDYKNHKWFVTPTKNFADFKPLNTLPEVKLDISTSMKKLDEGAEITVQLMNPSNELAFFVELRVIDDNGNSIVPVLWDDNYLSVLPGESRELKAQLPTAGEITTTTLAVQGWNSPGIELALEIK